MKLYQTPGGTWAGSEKEWKDAMKAEGSDPKAAERKIVEVPVDKKGLMEFLTFHNVNVVNPQLAAAAPEVTGGDAQPPSAKTPSSPVAPQPTATTVPLDEAVRQAPLPVQLDLVVGIVDRAAEVIRTMVPQNPRD